MVFCCVVGMVLVISILCDLVVNRKLVRGLLKVINLSPWGKQPGVKFVQTLTLNLLFIAVHEVAYT